MDSRRCGSCAAVGKPLLQLVEGDAGAVDPLGKLAALRGVTFDWDDDHGGHHDLGFIAEEVGKVLPELVAFEDDGIHASGMDYSKMTPLLVEAVNALRAEKDAEIKSLRASNEDLQRQLDELRSQISALADR